MTKILIVVSDLHKKISNILLNSAISSLEEHNIGYEKIIVPGTFELASAINMGLETFDYNGVIVLGCVVYEQTTHCDIITRECARAVQDISIYYSIPLGFGLLLVGNLDDAFSKAAIYGKNAANSCVKMMKIKEQFMMYNERKYSKFN